MAFSLRRSLVSVTIGMSVFGALVAQSAVARVAGEGTSSLRMSNTSSIPLPIISPAMLDTFTNATRADSLKPTLIARDRPNGSGISLSTPPVGTSTATTNSCSCWYMGVYEEFRIFGKNFDNKTIGPWGQGLLDNIRGPCGPVTRWFFAYSGFPMDPTADWEASGQVILGKCGCVGQAVLAVGGVNLDGCA